MKPFGMPETDLLSLFTRPLEAVGSPYFVTGSMAGMIYGEPRLTMDVDLVLVLSKSNIDTLLEAFNESDFYRPPREVLLQECSRPQRGHFNLIHHETGFKADVYLAGNDPLHAWAMDRRRLIEIGQDKIWIAPPEYVILRKLEFFREGRSEKHLRDIHSMIDRSAAEIDEPMLLEMIEKQGLTPVWQHFNAWRSL